MTKCIGVTATGRKCKANAVAGSQYCYAHVGGKVAKPSVLKVRHTRRRAALYTPRRYLATRPAGRRVCSRSRRATLKSRSRSAARNLFQTVDRSSCRPKTDTGRAARKLPGDMVIPTAREYIMQFPEAERKQKLIEYLGMSGCELAKIAVHRQYKRKQ